MSLRGELGLSINGLRAGAAIVVVLAVSACGLLPVAVPFEPLPVPAMLTPVGFAGVTDARGAFRSVVCRVVAERRGRYPDERRCEDMLHDLGGEEASVPLAGLRHEPANILIVPGVFGECVARQVTPFSDGKADADGRKTEHPYAYIEELGYRVDVVPLYGRASSETNALLVKEALLRLAAEDKPVIIVAYSKGVPDTLEALRQMGRASAPRNLRALVSVAGVVAGTPIADRLGLLYESVLSQLPFPGCPPTSSNPVTSLSRAERLRKLQFELTAIPDTVLLYSLGAFTQEENITTVLRPFYQSLSSSDSHNDGQILYYDAVLPRSRLLGYVNSDHWAFALAFNRADQPLWRTLVDHNAFPREVLLEAILNQVWLDAAR